MHSIRVGSVVRFFQMALWKPRVGQSIEPAEPKFRLDALDGVRGVAALIVLLSHTSHAGAHLLPFLNCAGVGKIGVYLFFVLSSFLLTYPFVQKGKKAFSVRALVHYALRRFFRIYPLLLLYLLAALFSTFVITHSGQNQQLAAFILPFNLNIREFIESILLLQAKGVTWTIPVEFHYYFVLPLLAFVFSFVVKNRMVPCLLLTAILIGSAELLFPAHNYAFETPNLAPFLPIFFTGSVLAVCHHNWNSTDFSQDSRVRAVLDGVGILCLAILLASVPSITSVIVGHNVSFRIFHRQFLAYALLWSAVVFCCLNGRGLIKRVFELSFFRHLGKISYSFYLLHPLCVYLLVQLWHPFANLTLCGWLVLGCTILVSEISYLIIEKPFLNMKIATTTNSISQCSGFLLICGGFLTMRLIVIKALGNC